MLTLRTSRAWVAVVAALILGVATSARAQRVEQSRAGVSASVRQAGFGLSGAGPSGALGHLVSPQDTIDGPPISPRRAFLYSFVLPGAGQARLDRAYAGGMFFLVEVAALTLLARSAEDLRIARAFAGDSMPLRYDIDPVTGIVGRDDAGAPIVLEWSRPRYNDDFVRTRQLHVEDWLAVLFFNHLFAGADAFVAAQLWDLDAKLGMRQSRAGTVLSARIPFR